MKLVLIESPYQGNFFIRWRNKIYARRCMKDSLNRGEAPFASHLLYTQVLNDKIWEERKAGIHAGQRWGNKADITTIYNDYGISSGMKIGIARAKSMQRSIEYRHISKNLDWLWKIFKEIG